MGEIGIDRHEYLYELTACDMFLIERGYERRNRHLWSSTRWGTYHIMLATCGTKALQESGIYKPTDLIQFPWERSSTGNLTEEDIADLVALSNQEINEQ